MTVNLMDLAKTALGSGALGKIAGSLGESEEKTTSAMDIAGSAILGSLIKKVSSPEGAKDVFKEVEQFDTGLLDSVGDLLTGGAEQQQSSGWASMGSKLIASLLGGKQDSVIGMISKLTGIGQGSSKSLLSMLAPLLLGMIAKKVKSGNLGLSDLVELVMGQKSYVAKALPAEFGQQLGIANLLDQGADAVRDTSERVTRAAQETAGSGAGLVKALVPLAILAVVGLGAWKLFSSKPAQEVAQKTAEVATAAADTAVDAAADVSDRITLQKPAIPDFNFEAISGELGTTFGNLTKSVSGISDEATAREALPQITELQKQFQGYGFDKLPEAQASTLSQMLSPMMEKLQAALEIAYRIPGVKEILEPAVSGLIDSVRGIHKSCLKFGLQASYAPR